MTLTTILIFFALGVPLAFFTERIIWRLTAFADPSEESLGRKELPWQVEPWATRLRVGLALMVPMATVAASARFEVGQAIAVSVLLIALLVCTATDLLRYRVPNAVTYPGVMLALAAALLLPGGDIAGALLGAGMSGIVFVATWAVTSGGIGLADVKLAALIGAALGFSAALTALAVGVVAGGVVMGGLLLAGVVSRRQVTPYAPFLALTAMAVVLTDGAAFAPI